MYQQNKKVIFQNSLSLLTNNDKVQLSSISARIILSSYLVDTSVRPFSFFQEESSLMLIKLDDDAIVRNFTIFILPCHLWIRFTSYVDIKFEHLARTNSDSSQLLAVDTWSHCYKLKGQK